MTDYLKDIGRAGRIVTIALLGLTATALDAMIALIVVAMLRAKPEAGAIAVFGATILFLGTFASAAVWMILRLLREDGSSEGVTIIPVRFIQGFGLLMLAGAVASAVMGIARTRFAVGGVVLAVNMILLSGLIRGK